VNGLLARLFADLHRPLRLSAALTTVGLILMVWSLAVPRPLPIMLAFTAGQGIGTLAFALYLAVIVIDIRRRMVERRDAADAATAATAATTAATATAASTSDGPTP